VVEGSAELFAISVELFTDKKKALAFHNVRACQYSSKEIISKMSVGCLSPKSRLGNTGEKK